MYYLQGEENGAAEQSFQSVGVEHAENKSVRIETKEKRAEKSPYPTKTFLTKPNKESNKTLCFRLISILFYYILSSHQSKTLLPSPPPSAAATENQNGSLT